MTRKQLILLFATIGALIIIGIIINALIPRATLLFSVAPESVKVMINGKSHDVTNGQSITVAPGEVTIEISRDEFSSYGEKLTVKNHETKEILVALDAQTESAKQLLLTTGAQKIIQRIGGKKVQQGGDALTKAYPLLTELPISDKFYKILPCDSVQHPDDSSKIAICVQLFDLEAKQSAIDEITRRGFDVANYEMIYQDVSYNTTSNE